MHDIAIIGRGVVGLAVAYRAKVRYPDLDVVVIGSPTTRGTASTASGAMIGCFGEVTKYTFATPASVAKFDLCRVALGRWPIYLEELASRIAPPDGLRLQRGTYIVLNAQGGHYDSENYTAIIDALDRHGEPYSLLESVPGVKTYANQRPLRSVFLPNEGSIDSNLFLPWLEQINRSLGVQFVDDNVVDIGPGSARPGPIRLQGGGVVDAGATVLCAGAFSWPLLEPLVEPGSHIPIVSGSGVAVVTHRTIGAGFRHVVRTPNRAGSCGLHLVPLAENREYIGATNVIFREPEMMTHLGVCHFLIQAAVDQLNQDLAFSRVIEWRIGNRPVPLDTYPLIGPVQGYSNFYLASGTYRDGFHASPVIAERVLDHLIAGRSAPDDQFRPARPYIFKEDASWSAAEFAGQAIASMYESGLQLPRFNFDDEFAEPYKRMAARLHEDLGIDRGLHPDIVNFLTLSSKAKEIDREWFRTFLSENQKVYGGWGLSTKRAGRD